MRYYQHLERRPFSALQGITLSKIEGLEKDSGTVLFYPRGSNTPRWQMAHHQSWGSDISIEDITGDVDDLLHTPILEAYEESREADDFTRRPGYEAEQTWTFYRLRTINGTVTIRWFGSSNGCYSTSVDFEELVPETEE